MAALDVFKEVGKLADADFLAIDALPILWSFSLGPLLNIQEFQAFMTLIKSLSTRIEQEQTRKLQEMSSTTSASANRADFMSSVTANRTNGLESSNGDEGDFESLVLGRKKPGSDALDPWASAAPSSLSSPGTQRTQSQQNSSPSATFSWSTPPPQALPTRTTANGASSRAITPDQSLSAFAPLQPQSSTTTSPSFSQPLHPSRPMNTTLAPSNPSAFPRQAGQPVDWSAAANSNWSANPTINPAPVPTPNIWAQPQTSTPSFGQPLQPTQPSAFSIAPPPASPYSTFSIAPPPAGGASRQPSYNAPRAQQTQQASGQKQGMDKYESLL
jgi:SCY1-like protein 2